jgi:hypothetical protein
MYNSFLNCWPEVQILSGTPFDFNYLEILIFRLPPFLHDLPQNGYLPKTAEIRHSPNRPVWLCGEDVANLFYTMEKNGKGAGASISPSLRDLG